MAHRYTLDDIKDFKPGDKLLATKLNAMLNALRAVTDVDTGFADEQTDLSAHKSKSTTPWSFTIENTTGATIPAFSVFSIVTGSSHAVPCSAIVRKIGQSDNGSHLLMLTNGVIEIPAGAKGVARPIDMWEPIELKAKAGAVPGIGEPCGVHPDTYEVATGFHGMVCLSAVSSTDRIWVMRAREPVMVIGRVTQAITAGDPCNALLLGTGKIKVYVRVGGGAGIAEAGSPSTNLKPWILDVYNPTSMTYPVDTVVTATSTLGIGLVVNAQATDIRAFQLTSDLPCGGTATAELFDCNGVLTGANVVVRETFDYRKGLTGYRGWGIRLFGPCTANCVNQYWVIELEHKAHYIEGTALAPASGGQVNMTVNRYMLGKNPGSTVTVYDPDLFFPRILTGGKIKAILSECDDKYYIVNAQQMTFRMKCQANANICGSSFAQKNASNLMFSPFNLLPTLPSTLLNPLGHACLLDDQAVIEWDEAAEEWFVKEVQHHEVSYLKKIRYKAPCLIQGLSCKAYVELCEPCPDELVDNNWTTLITMYEHAYVADADLAAVQTGSGSGISCKLRLEVKTDKVCGFLPPNPSAPTYSDLNFSPLNVVVDVYDDGTCLKEVTQRVYVLCYDPTNAATDVVCTTDCTGSGT